MVEGVRHGACPQEAERDECCSFSSLLCQDSAHGMVLATFRVAPLSSVDSGKHLHRRAHRCVSCLTQNPVKLTVARLASHRVSQWSLDWPQTLGILLPLPPVYWGVPYSLGDVNF